MATFLTVPVGEREALIKRLAIDPDEDRVVGDVRYWAVGRNASHVFYLGVDAQGQLWTTAFGDGDDRLCDCPWNAFCRCERLDTDEVLTRYRRPVKDGDQLYLGR